MFIQQGPPSRFFRFALCGIILLCLILSGHFFETFPNGWAQAEYAWAIDDNFLPHSPYFLYYLLGELFSIVFAAPVALTLLSLTSAIVALVTMALLCRNLNGASLASEVAALCAAALMGGAFLFVRQSATQEV